MGRFGRYKSYEELERAITKAHGRDPERWPSWAAHAMERALLSIQRFKLWKLEGTVGGDDLPEVHSTDEGVEPCTPGCCCTSCHYLGTRRMISVFAQWVEYLTTSPEERALMEREDPNCNLHWLRTVRGNLVAFQGGLWYPDVQCFRVSAPQVFGRGRQRDLRVVTL